MAHTLVLAAQVSNSSHLASSLISSCRQAVFTGTGSTSVDASTNGAAPPVPAQTSAEEAWAGVEEGKPTTSLQLRLADGSRMVDGNCGWVHAVSGCRQHWRHRVSGSNEAAIKKYAVGYMQLHAVTTGVVVSQQMIKWQ